MLQSIGLQRVRHDWAASLSFFLQNYNTANTTFLSGPFSPLTPQVLPHPQPLGSHSSRILPVNPFPHNSGAIVQASRSCLRRISWVWSSQFKMKIRKLLLENTQLLKAELIFSLLSLYPKKVIKVMRRNIVFKGCIIVIFILNDWKRPLVNNFSWITTYVKKKKKRLSRSSSSKVWRWTKKILK